MIQLIFGASLGISAFKVFMNKHSRAVFFLLVFLLSVPAYGQTPPSASSAAKGRNPIIIIPGLTGSELVNARTGEEVWFKARRAKDDDLRLPISPYLARNRDNLVPRDIIRTVKYFKILPEVEIYERLIDALERRGGYKEGTWKNPPRDGYKDTFYVFSYDWRLDNVENARLLIRRMDQVRRTLRRPNLKFNVVAHSMGGLIARYAAMYGTAEPPANSPRPMWAGAKYFDKMFLLGTPNEGSISALNALLNGFSYIGGGLNLPFIQDINRFDVFTIPSIFELLPHEGSLTVFDENLKPMPVDIYDPATWEEYGWSIWLDPAFNKRMSASEQRNARPYFQAILKRAKQFQAALDAGGSEKSPIPIYLIGADCKPTANAVLLVKDPKKNEWKTIFKPSSFTRSDGTKVSDTEVASLMTATGDGVVTKQSLAGESVSEIGKKPILSPVSSMFQCEDHNKLVTNPDIQDKLLQMLSDGPAK